MLIRSQEGQEIVSCSAVRIQYSTGSFTLWGEGPFRNGATILGIYKTNEEAKIAMDKINKHIDKCGENKICRLDCEE